MCGRLRNENSEGRNLETSLKLWAGVACSIGHQITARERWEARPLIREQPGLLEGQWGSHCIYPQEVAVTGEGVSVGGHRKDAGASTCSRVPCVPLRLNDLSETSR